MDRSEQYQAMCRRAEEIQRRWRPVYGDFYVDEQDRIACWLEEKEDGRAMKGPVMVERNAGLIRLRRFVWLPRLNQLMEAAQEPGCRFETMAHHFFRWCKTGYGRQAIPPAKFFLSLEQTWMAFIMFKGYGKVWDGVQWVDLD